MTIDELIERLTEYRDDLGGDATVRLMTQQNWPFENEIHGITSSDEINDLDDDDATTDRLVYIVEGKQIGYGSKRAWDAAGHSY